MEPALSIHDTPRGAPHSETSALPPFTTCRVIGFRCAPGRDGIVSFAPERVAPEQAPHREPAASPEPVAADGLFRVRGAARLESTRRCEEGGNALPIKADQPEGRSRRRRRSIHSLSSRSSTSKEASYASRRARTSTSTARPALSSLGRTCVRATSRKRRFSLFRRAAVCLWRGTTSPTREHDAGEGESKTSRCAVLLLFPRRKSWRISGPPVIRRARGYRLRPSCGEAVTGSRAYFDPTLTARRFRPRRRRAFSTLRPPRVFMRARKPCLFRRFRFRGLYVGLPMANYPCDVRVSGMLQSQLVYQQRCPNVKSGAGFGAPTSLCGGWLTYPQSTSRLGRASHHSPPLTHRRWS